jgi:hypothetical protein
MGTTLFITLTHVSCYKCGVVFGVESTHHERLLKTHDWFYCPNGHHQAYFGKTKDEQRIADLEREAKALKSSKDYWSDRAVSAERDAGHQRSRVNGYKGILTRTKKKIAAGRCPCCSHQFKNLESHMKTKHPNFDPEKGAEALAEKA